MEPSSLSVEIENEEEKEATKESNLETGEKEKGSNPAEIDSEKLSELPKKKSGFVLSDLSFEELKLEVRMMPTVVTRKNGAGCAERGRSSSEGGVGSMTENPIEPNSEKRSNKNASKAKMRQQFSLNDELLSRDRLQANHEVRKRIRKQQSLPDEGPKKFRTLRQSFMMAVKKAPTFENLKNSFSLFRVPEEDPGLAETGPPQEQEDGHIHEQVGHFNKREYSSLNVITLD